MRDREAQLRSEAAAAAKAGDPAAIYRSHHLLGLQLEAAGALEMAETSISQAVAASSHDSLLEGHAAAANDHGVVLARLGRHADASTSFERAAEYAIDGKRDGLAPAVKRNQGLLAWTEGRPSRGLDLWNSAFGSAREADDAAASAQILNNVAVLRLLEDESQEAMQLFNRAILLAQRGGDLRGLAFTYNNLGLVFSGHTRGNHFAAIPFVEMALALLTGPVDILARLYVLNNNILVFEQAHMEPARKFRTQFAETLKFFNSIYPRRSADLERIVYTGSPSESPDDDPADDEWEISPHPVLLRPCSRCGVPGIG